MARFKGTERRQQLLDVATRLFAERGFDATTTASIAEAAQVSEPMLYRHFTNKQNLFTEIVRNVTNTTQAHWKSLLQDVTDPAEALKTIFREWPAHLARCRTEYCVIHCALITSKDPAVRKVLSEHYTQTERFMRQLIEAAQKQGKFLPYDSTTAAWWMLFAGMGYTVVELSLGIPAAYQLDEAIRLTLRAMSCPEAQPPKQTPTFLPRPLDADDTGSASADA